MAKSSDITLGAHNPPPEETPEFCLDHFGVNIDMGKRLQMEQIVKGKSHQETLFHGTVAICSIHRSHFFHGDNQLQLAIEAERNFEGTAKLSVSGAAQQHAGADGRDLDLRYVVDQYLEGGTVKAQWRAYPIGAQLAAYGRDVEVAIGCGFTAGTRFARPPTSR